MKNIKRTVYIFLYALIMQFFGLNAFSETISDAKFTELTGSDVEDVFCVNSQIDENLNGWPNNVAKIKLRLNVEKYMSSTQKKIANTLKKIQNDVAVSSHKEKYRKIDVKVNGIDCWMSGKYRLTGDLLDHVGNENEIIHSIKVKLTDGRIDNILKFKLFAPKTRTGKLEVLNSLIHQKLGLLAPRTALVDVQIGGQIYSAIFQEDISEQLLEYNDIHQAMLLEGDEGFLPFNFPRIINRDLFSNAYFRDISIYALERLGQGYQFTSAVNNDQDYDSPIFLDFLPENSKEEFIYFHLLNYSLNNIGGLTLDDSRFVFDHISRQYRPIYYDGHAKRRISKISDINFDVPAKIQFRLLSDLESIDPIKLQLELRNLGAVFSIEELQQILGESTRFIKSAKYEMTALEIKESFEKSVDLSRIELAAKELMRNKNLSTLQLSWMSNSSEFQQCIFIDIGETKCSSGELNVKGLPPHLKIQSPRNGLFLYGLGSESLKAPYFHELTSNRTLLSKTGTIVEHTSNLHLAIDLETKSVRVMSKAANESTSQIRVYGGNLDGWTFVVEKGVNLGYDKVDGTRASKFGLTGCITFNDIALKSLKVIINDSKCEDSIHFVRARGNIESITVDQALADGIDADFSDLNFNNLNISNVGNDCVDFSAGTYQIISNKFHNCGDKGVSAGENSNVVMDQSNINDALIGIVAKDGARVTVNKASILNVDVCLAAYKKKQEHSIAHLDVKQISCSSDKYFVQNGSYLHY